MIKKVQTRDGMRVEEKERCQQRCGFEGEREMIRAVWSCCVRATVLLPSLPFPLSLPLSFPPSLLLFTFLSTSAPLHPVTLMMHPLSLCHVCCRLSSLLTYLFTTQPSWAFSLIPSLSLSIPVLLDLLSFSAVCFAFASCTSLCFHSYSCMVHVCDTA